jgi:hypothetical protein
MRRLRSTSQRAFWNTRWPKPSALADGEVTENETFQEIRLAASSAFVPFGVPANDGGACSLTLFRSAANLGSPVGFEESSNIRMSGFDGRF